MLTGRSGYDIVTTQRAESEWTPVPLLSAQDAELDVADGRRCTSPARW